MEFSLKKDKAEGTNEALHLFLGVKLFHSCCCVCYQSSVTRCVGSFNICISFLYSLFACRVLKLSCGFSTSPAFFFLCNLFQPPCIKLWNNPTPTDRTKHNKATYYSIIRKLLAYLNWLQMISAFSCNTFWSSLFSTQIWCSLSSSIYCQKPHLSTYMCLPFPLLLL